MMEQAIRRGWGGAGLLEEDSDSVNQGGRPGLRQVARCCKRLTLRPPSLLEGAALHCTRLYFNREITRC